MSKSKKFDVNPEMAKVFNKFMLWYNQVVETAEELADIAKTDETESGEVSLKYYTSDNDYIEVKEDGVAVASDGSAVEDGEYPLVDGSVIVIADGKFVETKPADQADEAPISAPVAEEKTDVEEEEKKEEDVEEKPADVEDEEKKEETQEEVEAPYTLISVEIDGVEFQVPQEVADYIHTLEDKLSGVETQIAQMKERIPSAKPVNTVIKQSKEEDEVVVNPTYSTLIGALNKKMK